MRVFIHITDFFSWVYASCNLFGDDFTRGIRAVVFNLSVCFVAYTIIHLMFFNGVHVLGVSYNVFIIHGLLLVALVGAYLVGYVHWLRINDDTEEK